MNVSLPKLLKGDNQIEHHTFDNSALSTKEKIFLVAIDLFSTKGFNGVSIRDITKEVGIRESSFYKHFKSKDELLDSIFGYFNSEFAKAKIPETINDDQILKTIDPVMFLKRAFELFSEHADTPLMDKIYRIAVMEQFRDSRAKDILISLYEKPLPIMEYYFHLILSQKEGQPYSPRIMSTSYQFALQALVAELALLKQYQQDTVLIERRIEELCTFYGEFLRKISQ